MASFKVMFALVLLSTTNVVQNISEASHSGFGLELLLTKVKYLHDMMVQIESLMKEVNLKLSSDINQLNQSLNILQTQSKTTEQIVKTKLDHQSRMIRSSFDLRNASFESCKDNLSKHSGAYVIQPTSTDVPFMGYCEQSTFGGGWLVFQHRKDGSVDFSRNLTDYHKGFGSLEGEFWLGLELLHRLTSARPHELLIEMKDYNGQYEYARYSEFRIGSEPEQYALLKLGLFSGTAVNAFNLHEGAKFSTKNTKEYEGAWWYYDGWPLSNLNGPYKGDFSTKSMFWGTSWNHHSKAYSRMLIREI